MEKLESSKLFSTIKLLLISAFLFLIFTLHVGATAPTITGNSTADFSGLPGVKDYTDPSGDIGVPALIGTSTDTGWNIINTYVWYDVTTDKLYVGIKCTKICGDADGDGSPGTTSATLAGIPGSDTDWGPGETGAFIINTNVAVNTNFNIIVGKRTNNSGIASWGIYYFNQATELSAGVDSNWLLPDVLDPNRPAFIATSTILAATHDLEFVINDFSTLHGVDKSNMKIGVFMGSSTDDGIGEDTLAGQGTPFSVQKLTVVKQVINDDGGTKVISDFPLSVDNGIGSVTSGVGVSALTAIPYTVSETQQAGYSQTSLTCVDDTTHLAVTHPVTFAAGQNVTCTIVNDDIAPKLKVVKTVINDNGGTKVVSDFPLSIAPTIGTVTSGTQNTVKAGIAYTVSETQQTGYTQTSLTCIDDISHAVLPHPVTLTLAQTATCTIVNDDIAPKLTIVKSVINDDGGTKINTDFPLNVSPAIGVVVTGVQTTVTAGVAYTASETQQAGYSQTSLTCVDDVTHLTLTHPVTLVPGQNATCTIVNDDIAPKLKIVKTVINDNGGTKVATDFPLNIAPTIGVVTTGVQTNVKAGIAYTASETQQAGYTQTSLTCIDDITHATLAHPITLVLAQTATCTIVNDDIAPKLKVIKTVINDNGGTKVISDFPLFIDSTTATSGTQYTSTAVTPHTVSETLQTGYTQTSLTCKDDQTLATVAHPVVLSLAQNVTCTIVNDDIAPKLTVVKVVVNDNGGNKTVADFPLSVAPTIGAVTSGTQTTVMAGVAYTASETQQAGYTQTSLVCKDDTTSATITHPVTLALAQNATCTITNDDIAPKIKVVKQVINDNTGTLTPADFDLFVDGTPVTTGVQITTTANTPHTASETPEVGYTQKSLICTLDSDTSQTPIPHPVTLLPGQAATCIIVNDDIDPTKACIGDRVFEDLNGNGIEDSTDIGIPNVIVKITLLNNTTLTTTTDSTGTYSFCNLIPGSYKVEVDKTQTAITSYPNFSYGYDPTTPLTYTRTLNSGDFYKQADFGFISYAKIGDQVFIDKDKNCIFDGDNKGVEGLKINLKDSTGVIQTTLTDKDGFYFFLVPSNKIYTVEVDPSWKTLPALDLGTPNCGETKDSPKLTTHQTYLDLDFGFDKAFPFDIHDPAQTQCLGVEIHFIIDIKNISSLTARNIKFTDQLPKGVRFISFTSTSPSNGSSVSGNELQVKFDSMPGNSVITMNIIGISSEAGKLTNTSFASDETGLLVSHIEKADVQIIDSGMPACKLPDTGASSNNYYLIAFALFSLGLMGYKVTRREV